MRFGPDRRLRRRAEFDRVFAEGVRERARGFLLVVARGAGERSRLGITVGKRYGNAVRRNQIKRRLREAFRRGQQEIPEGLDLVVLPRPELRDVRFDELSERLLRAARRAASRLES